MLEMDIPPKLIWLISIAHRMYILKSAFKNDLLKISKVIESVVCPALSWTVGETVWHSD